MLKKNQPLLNEKILLPHFLLIDENGQKEQVSRQEALKRTEETGLDLLCVSVNPPVCKLVNYYELKKGQKKPKKSVLQEIKFSYNVEENDLEIKLNKIKKLTEKGSTVKISLIRHGREKSEEKSKTVEEKCQAIIEKIQQKFPQIRLKDKIQKTPANFYFFLYQKKK